MRYGTLAVALLLNCIMFMAMTVDGALMCILLVMNSTLLKEIMISYTLSLLGAL